MSHYPPARALGRSSDSDYVSLSTGKRAEGEVPVELIEKARILAEAWIRYDSTDDWAAPFEDMDLGFPYAFGLAQGHIITLSYEGARWIEAAWDYFCDLVGVNSTSMWTDLDHVMANSTDL